MIRPKTAVLFLARTLGLFRLARWATRSHLRILCYHGGCMGDEQRYNPKLFCTTETFRARMQWLQRNGFNMMSLSSAVKEIETGARPAKPLRTVITFDDGWASTATELVPVLAEMAIPSTLYLCTSHYLEGWPLVSVTVRYAIWKSQKTHIRIDDFHPDVDGAYDLVTLKDRTALALRIVETIAQNSNNSETVRAWLERVGRCFGLSQDELALDTRRFQYLTKEELQMLPAAGCSVELHGHVHRYPAGTPQAFYDDLVRCREVIVEQGLPKPVHYCYPSGSFDGPASDVMAKLEIESATTCVPGLISTSEHTRRYYLPRFLDGEDVDPLEFEAEVSGFSELIRRMLRKLLRKKRARAARPRDLARFPPDQQVT
jgi:peptidoglycan/xylan/chitin deacetylase (PgdA/CDA1 family)